MPPPNIRGSRATQTVTPGTSDGDPQPPQIGASALVTGRLARRRPFSCGGSNVPHPINPALGRSGADTDLPIGIVKS
jgi:hypothetical protein